MFLKEEDIAKYDGLGQGRIIANSRRNVRLYLVKEVKILSRNVNAQNGV